MKEQEEIWTSCYEEQKKTYSLNTTAINLLNDLALTPFHVASIFDDVDDQAWAFTTLLTDVIDIHALVRQFHFRGGHEPYMTHQW